MASKATTSLLFFLALNLILFTVVNACECSNPSPPPPPPSACPPPPEAPTPKPPKPAPSPKSPKPAPTPKPPKPAPSPKSPKPAPTPKPPAEAPSTQPTCPKDALKLRACAKLLGIVPINIESNPKKDCCSLISGLADLEAALCLCTEIKANVLGIHLNLPIDVSVILNDCDRKLSGFKCPSY